jgi:hypothetical protein
MLLLRLLKCMNERGSRDFGRDAKVVMLMIIIYCGAAREMKSQFYWSAKIAQISNALSCVHYAHVSFFLLLPQVAITTLCCRLWKFANCSQKVN